MPLQPGISVLTSRFQLACRADDLSYQLTHTIETPKRPFSLLGCSAGGLMTVLVLGAPIAL